MLKYYQKTNNRKSVSCFFMFSIIILQIFRVLDYQDKTFSSLFSVCPVMLIILKLCINTEPPQGFKCTLFSSVG